MDIAKPLETLHLKTEGRGQIYLFSRLYGQYRYFFLVTDQRNDFCGKWKLCLFIVLGCCSHRKLKREESFNVVRSSHYSNSFIQNRYANKCNEWYKKVLTSYVYVAKCGSQCEFQILGTITGIRVIAQNRKFCVHDRKCE